MIGDCNLQTPILRFLKIDGKKTEDTIIGERQSAALK